ncbi:MAG: hypothetical protein DI539_12215 [Flavobacterium psychrophilum]|nr:MAG: hypothetical protein DI539_12215 [Flavobacterium psychrophilum]
MSDSHITVTDVASRLTYDKSNFTKFFKHYEGITPTEFRKSIMEPVLA